VLHLLILEGILGVSRVFDGCTPIQFECGMDEEHFALSFSFGIREFSVLRWDGISERVLGRKPGAAFDELLLQFCENSKRVVLKCDAKGKRIEICAIHDWGRKKGKDLAALDLVLFTGEPEAAPPVKEVTALGDMDYSSLLKSRSKDERPPVTGEVLVHGAKNAQEMVERIRAKKLGIAGSDVVRIEASKENQEVEEQKIVLKASEKPKDDRPKEIRISKSSPEESSKKGGFFSRLKGLVAGKQDVEPTRDDGEALAPQEADSAARLPIHEGGDERSESTGGDSASDPGRSEKSSASSKAESSETTGDIDLATGQLESAIPKDALSIPAELQSPRAERWVDNLTAELNAERSRIVELSRKLKSSFRSKEIEFKGRENALQQQIRERDETLKTKNVQINRMKEQLAKMQISLERSKMTTTTEDDSATKHKLQQSQKLLQMARNESDSLKARITELQDQAAKANEQRSKNTVSLVAHQELQKKLERQAKQIEDLKRQKSTNPDEARGAEAKNTLEAAQRVALRQKQKMDQLELVIQEQKVELERLKKEVEKSREKDPKLAS
jgi:hypothetical protein